MSVLVKPDRRKQRIKEDRLDDKERIFCAEYIANGMKAPEAAAVVYPKHRGKRNVLSTMSANMLKRPRVKMYLGQLLQERLEHSGLTTERVLKQLETALFADPLDIFEPGDLDGVYKMKSLDEIPRDLRRCINKLKFKVIETDEGDREIFAEIEFINKEKALEMAMKYRGLLKDSGVVVNNTNNISVNFDSLADSEDIDVIEARLVSEERAAEQSDPVSLTHEESKDG